jgi:hypothetical protein
MILKIMLDRSIRHNHDEASLVESSRKEHPVVTVIRYKCEASADRHDAASTGSGVVMVDGGQAFCSQGGNRPASQAKTSFFA